MNNIDSNGTNKTVIKIKPEEFNKTIQQNLNQENEQELREFLTKRSGLNLLVRHKNPQKWQAKSWINFRDTMYAEEEWLHLERILRLVGISVLSKEKKEALESYRSFFSKHFIETFKKFLPMYVRCTFGRHAGMVMKKNRNRNYFSRIILPEIRIAFVQTCHYFKEKNQPILEVLRPKKSKHRKQI